MIHPTILSRIMNRGVITLRNCKVRLQVRNKDFVVSEIAKHFELKMKRLVNELITDNIN